MQQQQVNFFSIKNSIFSNVPCRILKKFCTKKWFASFDCWNPITESQQVWQQNTKYFHDHPSPQCSITSHISPDTAYSQHRLWSLWPVSVALLDFTIWASLEQFHLGTWLEWCRYISDICAIMGNDVSCNRPYIERQMSNATGKDIETLQTFYNDFRNECPSGKLSPQKFTELCKKVSCLRF